MPLPTSPWNNLLSDADSVGGAPPGFTVNASSANSLVTQFGNWSFAGNLDILALDAGGAPAPTSLAIAAAVPVVVFAAGTGGVQNWQLLSSITITGGSDYVILSGAETAVANGGGLIQSGNTSLSQIVNTASTNSFYDLSGLDFATVTGLALQGGNGLGVGEIALSNQVLTHSPSVTPLVPPWTGIQVIDAVGDSPGGTIDLANFGTLDELAADYVLRTNGSTPLSAPAGNVVVQFLNAFGSTEAPIPALTADLGVINGPRHLAVNLQGIRDAGKSLNFSISGLVAPLGSTLATWLSDDVEAENFTSVGYGTDTFFLPIQTASATRNGLFLGTAFFQVYPGAATGSFATATFRDSVAGTTIATANDLYLGRTTSDRSQPFSDPTEAVGHDSIEFRGEDSVLNADGAGMTFLGTSDLATVNGADSGGIVMDVGGSHTGKVTHVSGITVTGSRAYQNLLQGSSGQIESPRTGTGPWDASTVYTSTAVFGQTGNGLMGIGNDILKGGAGTPQPGSDSAGGDNFFGMGGNDEITLDTTPGRFASTIWIGYYAVGHADNGAAGARTGSAAVLNTYGQAITTIDGNGNETYANGYGLADGYWDFTPPASFGAEGWTTSIKNFQAGAGGDRLNFNPPDWISGNTFLGTALGLVNGNLDVIGPGGANAQRMNALSRQVAATTTLVLDGFSTYATAADLAAGLGSPGGYLAFAPTTGFGIGSSFHMLVAYATSAAMGSLHVADVWVENQSIANPAAGFATNAGVSVQAFDLVHLDGLAGSDLGLLGDNVFFPIARTAGTSGSDTLTGNSTDQLLDAGDGDDTVLPGNGHEAIALGLGADIVRSTLSNLMGDTFRDLAGADRIVLTGIALKRSDLATDDGGLSFRVTHDGTIAGSFNLKYGLPGGDLMLAHVGGDTIITYVNHLPLTDEGSHVTGSTIKGIANRSYLNGDTSSSFSVRVEAAGGAAFHNTLGTYQVDGGGTISDVRILVGDVKSAPGLLTIGGLAAGSQLGLFLVQDGARVLPAAALNGGNLSFLPSGSALVLALDGVPVGGVNTFFTHDASRNIDGLEHVLSGVAPDGSGALRIGFEDLLRGGPSDDDFQDVVVTVTATGWLG